MSLSNEEMAPFFTPTNSYDDGDIILKSDDDVEFRVHTLILRQASPFFKGMLQMPQPVDFKNTSAIVMSGGSASEIDFILSCIYPVTRTIPMLDSLDKIADMLGMADKWDFPRVFAVMSINLLEFLSQGLYLMRIWIMGVQYDLLAVRDAAELQLIQKQIPLVPGPGSKPADGLRLVDGFEYARLLYQVAGPFNNEVFAPIVDTAPPHHEPSSPFKMTFPSTDADVLLQSNDGHRFTVHSQILSQASEWFAEQIVPRRKSSNEMQIIEVPADAASIDWILESIYPRAEIPTLSSLHELGVILKVAEALRIPRALSVLDAELMKLISTSDPLSVWAFGVHFNRNASRVAAVKHILRENIQIVQTTGHPPTSLRKVTAYELASLLVMRNDLYSQANRILRTALETMTCINGHRTSTYVPTMIDRSIKTGIFSDGLLSFHAVRQFAPLFSHHVCCSGIKLWEHHEETFCTTRAAIQALLDTIN